MKTAVQLAASGLALAGLLVGFASHATNLAELPLKASVLAKPNVIFGMDDSGSMDSEVMLYNNDGAFWWNYVSTGGTGWGIDAAHPNPSLRTITSTWFNNVGDASSTWRKMVYLFPNGKDTGKRVYGDSENDHFAVLPTTQFAFLRWAGVSKDSAGTLQPAPTDPAQSPVHNPLYYNPMVTYAPWAPAQLSSGPVTPANATTSAVKSHPMYGTGTFDLTTQISVAASPASNTVFTAFPGMTLPAGSRKNECDSGNSGCAGWADVATQVAATNSKVTRVSMTYHPATYWIKEACTPEATNVATDTCTTAPDGSTLKRYEIKSTVTSYPSGRDYAGEIQNFANWFQYYRKRKLMLAGAMGETMENLTGMRLGVVAFNNLSGDVTLYDADATAAARNRLRVAGIFYEANGDGGTPTRETLKYIGGQYARTDVYSAADATAGVVAATDVGKYRVVQFACQRNNAFLVTDGFANNSSVTPPSWNTGKSSLTWGATAPYAWDFSHDGVLADLALRYYTNNPRSTLTTGKMQITTADPNPDLHMNTYGLTLGARGTLFLSESSAKPTTSSAWPDPNTARNPTSVDDLWHATINGRGKMYLASTPEETALRIQAGLADILNQDGAQGGVAVSAVNLDRSDGKAYLGFYNPRGWVGDLEARSINTANAVIGNTATWSVASLLGARTWSNRIFFTASAGSGVAFDATNVGSIVNPDSASYTHDQVMDYLRGNRSDEGTLFRARVGLLGPVVNAEPVLAREERTVYVASGEGALHAFDTLDGSEQWAFVPPDSLASVGNSVKRGWVYSTLLDATPTYGKLANGAKMLVGGVGAAGRSYYALDVSSPRGLTATQAAAQFRWTFPTSGDTTNKPNMGYAVGKPVFARTAADGDVVLVTSGYDNGNTIGDGKGRLWMLNAATGAVIKTFVTTEGAAGTGEAGLAHVAAFREADGKVKYAYGGDLLGNVWKFDLTTADAGPHTATKLAVLKDGVSPTPNTQPVTSAPDLVMVGGKRVVLIGTGRVLDIGDFGSTKTQTFYAIADGAVLANARSSLTAKTYSRGANPEVTGSSPNWDTGRGWYMDIPAGEQINTDPIVAFGAVVFVGNKNGSSDCSQTSYLYLVDIGTGNAVTGQTTVSEQLSGTATSSRVVVLRDSTGQLHGTVQLSDRTIRKTLLPLGVTIPPAKNAWREIRR